MIKGKSNPSRSRGIDITLCQYINYIRHNYLYYFFPDPQMLIIYLANDLKVILNKTTVTV